MTDNTKMREAMIDQDGAVCSLGELYTQGQ